VANWNNDFAEGDDPLSPADYISVLLNDGTGALGEAQNYEVGEHPTAVCGGDLDLDGDIDLVVTIEGNFYHDDLPDYVVVLLNDGGTFYQAGVVQVGDHPHSVYSGDLDGNGSLDLVIVNGAYNNTVSVLLNKGDGTFSDGVFYDVGYQPTGVAGGDVDLDGDIDLVVCNAGDLDGSVLLGNGDGAFSDGGRYEVSGEPSGIYLQDLDGDGDLDLTVSDRSSNGISLLFNRTVERITGIEEIGAHGVIPWKHWLWANYPNPFNAATLIPFDLAFSGKVTLGVFDVLGRKVRTLMEEPMSTGHYTILWDGRDDEGHPVASGCYFYRLRASTFSESKAMTLIR